MSFVLFFNSSQREKVSNWTRTAVIWIIGRADHQDSGDAGESDDDALVLR